MNDASKLPIDGPSGVEGYTYRDMAEELDASDDLSSDWEIGFVADAIDHPETFRTEKQLERLRELWERRIGS